MKDLLFLGFLVLYGFRVLSNLILSFVFESLFYIREFITSSLWLGGELCLIYVAFHLLRKLPIRFLSAPLLFLVLVSITVWTIADPIVVSLAGDHLTPALLAHFAGFDAFFSDELLLPIREHWILVSAGVLALLTALTLIYSYSIKALRSSSALSGRKTLMLTTVASLLLVVPYLSEGRFLIYPPEVNFSRNYLGWDIREPDREQIKKLHQFLQDPYETLVDERYPLMVSISGQAHPQKLNVILIVIESLRASEYQIFNPKANFKMKAFDLFAKKGIVFPYLVSNGFPSVEGFASLTMGVWPHSKDRILVSHHDKHLPSLAMALRTNGYTTYAIEDYYDPEEEGYFIRKTYDHHITYQDSGEFSSEKSMFDDLRKIVFENDSLERPFFVHLKTRNPHYPYEISDDSLKRFYTVGSPAENYFASMKVMDGHLTEFYHFLSERRVFENSIVIITGDHANYLDKLHTTSLPTDETVWTGAIFAGPSATIPQASYNYSHSSHVDIHATLHDLFASNTPRLMFGRNLLAKDSGTNHSVSVRPSGVRLDYNKGSFTIDRNHPTQFLMISSFGSEPTSGLPLVSESDLLNIVDTWTYFLSENKVFDPTVY